MRSWLPCWRTCRNTERLARFRLGDQPILQVVKSFRQDRFYFNVDSQLLESLFQVEDHRVGLDSFAIIVDGHLSDLEGRVFSWLPIWFREWQDLDR